MPKTWTMDELSNVMRTYQGACVLLAGCELNLFEIFAQAPLTASELASAASADLRGVAMLADALTAMGVLLKSAGKYSLAPGVSEVFTAGGKTSMLAMAQHQANCLRSWADLARIAKTGKPHHKEPSVRGESADYAAFIEAMDNISRITAPQVIGFVPEIPFTHLLDVGGASGTWTIHFLKRHPAANATLFDLPKVLPQAKARFANAGMLSRVQLIAGDFMIDPLPAGADLAWVSAIIHQMSRAECRHLYASVFKALIPGGQILIRDHVMDATRTIPASGAFFAINMLVNTETGGTFTFDEIAEDLTSVGFTSPRLVHSEETMNCIVGATKAK